MARTNTPVPTPAQPDDDSMPFDLVPIPAETKPATIADPTSTEMTVADFETMLKGELAQELDALGGVSLPRIKIPSGGGIAFEIPSEDPNSPDVSKTIVGTIVAHHNINRLYLAAMGEGESPNSPPDCYSNDGITGNPSDGDEAAEGCYGGDCKECGMNQFGTARNGGKGKACSNRHRLVFLREGQMFPVIVDVPPTSLKAWREYAAAQLLNAHRPVWALVTEISLVKVKGPAVDYAGMQFKTVRPLSPTDALAMKALGERFKQTGI